MFDGNTNLNGVVFVPGSRTVLVFGSVGTNQVQYGTPSASNDPYRGGKGFHALNGDYAYQVWAYNADDFLSVMDGQEQPWQIQPYATWNLDFPQYQGGKTLGGVSFDPSTGRLYVVEQNADTQAPESSLPMIQVYQLTLSTSGIQPGIENAKIAPTGSVQQSAPSGLTPTSGAATTATIGTTVPVGTLSSATVAANNTTNTPQPTLLGTLSDSDEPAQPPIRRRSQAIELFEDGHPPATLDSIVRSHPRPSSVW